MVTIHSQHKNRKNNSLNNRTDIRFLLGAGICGLIGIPLLKLQIISLPEIISLGQNYHLVPSIWTALLLVGYAYLVKTAGSSQIEPETIGDNCYYLGFFFTLVSLAVTLFQINDTSPDSNLLRNIISGFGIALTSTILGIGLRVLFFQQRADLVARDRENQREIQEAVRDFKLALTDCSIRLKHFSIETVQLTGERDKKIRESTEGILEHQITNVSKLTKELGVVCEGIIRNVETIDKQFNEKITQSFTMLFEELRNSLTTNTKSVFQELEHSADKLKSVFDGISQDKGLSLAFSEIKESANRLNLEIDHLKRGVDGISELPEAATRVVKELDNTWQHQLKNAINNSQKVQGVIDNTIEAHQSGITRFLDNAWQQHLENVNSNSQKVHEIIEKTIETQHEGATRILGNVEENNEKQVQLFSSSISKINNSLSEFSELQDSAKRLKETLNNLGTMDILGQVNGAKSAFSELEKSIIQLNDEIGLFSLNLKGKLNVVNIHQDPEDSWGNE